MSVVPSRATMEAKLRILYGTGDARTGPTLNRPAYLTATLPSTDMPTQPSTSTHVTSKAAFDLTPARRDESDEDEELHCLCRKPEDGKTMIQCDDCDVWYHLACVKLRHVQVELIDQYICPPCTTKSNGERKSTRKTDLPLPISKRERNVTPPLELSSPVPISLLDPTFPIPPTSPIPPTMTQEEREYTPFSFARPPPSASPSRSPSPLYSNGSSRRPSPALPAPPPGVTPPLIAAPSRKRKASDANVRASRHERVTSPPEQETRWSGDMEGRNGANNAEGSGSGEVEGRTVSKKKLKSITLKIDRSKAGQSQEFRFYDDEDDNVMDDFDAVSEERRINRPKANGKGRFVGDGREHTREQVADSHAFKIDMKLPSTRPRPVKTKRKEKDGNIEGGYGHRRRSGASDNKDTTGDEDAVMNIMKRKPFVSPKISSAKVKRRPVNLKPRLTTVPKASSTAVATTSIAEDLLAQRGAPEPGPNENAVRGHCVGKLENAFVNVFLAFFRALVPITIPRQNQALDASVHARVLDRNESGEGEFVEVDPPIRITEPIVLDDDDIPRDDPATTIDNSSANPIISTDSGTVNPVSSSIEIVTGPHSSQHSIEHVTNGNTSQSVDIAGYVNLANGTIDESRITNDAVRYAQEVEAALFNKLKEFSREKRLWLPGAAYKQQYNLIISSLEGDLRPDLREGFATRKLSPTEVAAMNSRDLASIERLKEMQVYEQEALKSLLRIDDGKPVKIVKDGAENSEEATQEASTYPAIDLDMIIFDVDENESASTSQVGNPTQATQLDSSGSISLREQRIPNSRPLSTASSSALPRPYLTAESDLVNGVTDSQMARFTNPSTPTHVSLARADDDEMEQDDDTSESLLEALVEQYYDNHVENGSVWTATSSKHQADSITEDTFRRARTVWQGEIHNPADHAHPTAKVYARQAAGPDCSSYPGVWSLIFPSDALNLVGRVTTEASVNYIAQNQIMVQRELIIVAFSPAGGDEKAKADFEALVEFHHARDRHGRVTPWAGVDVPPPGAPKEMYLVPLKPDDSFDFLDLMPESVLPKSRTETFLLGVFLIAKTGNVLFPPEVLANQLPVNGPDPEEDASTASCTAIENRAFSRQEPVPPAANLEADRSHQSNATDSHPPLPSDPAPPLPPC